MGRCIYDGIYDPGSPLADAQGFWKDVLAALRELDIPVVRYPGGNFVATYHWQDGVGPRDKRPSRPELAWLGTGTNQFGTEEFMAWLDVLSEGKTQCVESYLCLNFGTGTLDTYYANLRRAHGDPEPYSVKYWALGNEVWDPCRLPRRTTPRRRRSGPKPFACSTRTSVRPGRPELLGPPRAQPVRRLGRHAQHPRLHGVRRLTSRTRRRRWPPSAPSRSPRVSSTSRASRTAYPPMEPPVKICFDSTSGTCGTRSGRLATRALKSKTRCRTVNVISPPHDEPAAASRPAEHLVAPLWLFSRYTCAAGTVAAHVRSARLRRRDPAQPGCRAPWPRPARLGSMPARRWGTTASSTWPSSTLARPRISPWS